MHLHARTLSYLARQGVSGNVRSVPIASLGEISEVTLLHDERGQQAGAELKPLDIPGEPVTRLTRHQFEMLDGTRYFERR